MQPNADVAAASASRRKKKVEEISVETKGYTEERFVDREKLLNDVFTITSEDFSKS